MRRLVLATGLAAALALGGATAASAHSYLVASTPADGEVLTALPGSFSVTANENLLDLSGDGAGFAIQVTDAAGAFYGDGCLTVAGPTLTMGASLGAPGSYRLVYQMVSADGHTVSGELAFQWDPTEGWDPATASAAPPVCGETVDEPSPTPTESAEPTTTPEPAASSTPIAQPEQDTADLGTVLWIGGAVLAALVAGGVTVLLLSRRRA